MQNAGKYTEKQQIAVEQSTWPAEKLLHTAKEQI